MGSNWRTEVDAEDYFGHQKKKLDIADRRPLIRRASDLVGPGIGPHARPLTNFNDILATFNGYYASEQGAENTPPGAGPFVGSVVSDSSNGGTQTFTDLDSGIEHRRIFRRNPSDPSRVEWSFWDTEATSSIRRYPSSSNTKVTSVLGATLQQLFLPTTSAYSGAPGVFSFPASGYQISVLLPGTYTGFVTVKAGATVSVRVYVPHDELGTALLTDHHMFQTTTATIHFSFDTSEYSDLVSFYFLSTGTSGGVEVVDFSLTRVGGLGLRFPD